MADLAFSRCYWLAMMAGDRTMQPDRIALVRMGKLVTADVAAGRPGVRRRGIPDADRRRKLLNEQGNEGSPARAYYSSCPPCSSKGQNQHSRPKFDSRARRCYAFVKSLR